MLFSPTLLFLPNCMVVSFNAAKIQKDSKNIKNPKNVWRNWNVMTTKQVSFMFLVGLCKSTGRHSDSRFNRFLTLRGGRNIKEWPRLFSFCPICRQTSGGEEGHVCGETGHSGDQKPAGEDQQHPRSLRRRREYGRDAGLSPVRPAVMWLLSLSAVRPPEPRLCGSHPVWDEPAGKNTHTTPPPPHPGHNFTPVLCFRPPMRTGRRASWMKRPRSFTRWWSINQLDLLL